VLLTIKRAQHAPTVQRGSDIDGVGATQTRPCRKTGGVLCLRHGEGQESQVRDLPERSGEGVRAHSVTTWTTASSGDFCQYQGGHSDQRRLAL